MADLPLDLIVPVAAAGTVAAAAGLGLGAWRARASGSATAPAWTSAVAIGAVFVVSQVVAFKALSGWPPNGARDWLPFVAVAAVMGGAVEGRLPTAARHALRLAVGVLAAYLIFRVDLSRWWPAALAMAGGVVVLAGTFGAAAQREARLGLMLPIAMVAGGGAAVVASSGTLAMGQLAGSIAIPAALALVAGLRWPALRLSGGAALPAAALTAACWAIGAAFADLPWLAAGLLLVAPLQGLGVAQLAAVKRMPWWTAAGVEAAAMAIPIAVAAGIAFKGSPDPSAYGAYGNG